MLKYRLNIDDEWKLGTPICFFLIGLYLRNATVERTFLSDNAKNIFSVSIRAIILVSFMIAIPIIFRRAARRMVLLIFAIVLGIILHALIFPANNIYFIGTAQRFMTSIFPIVMCAYAVRDSNALYGRLLAASLCLSVMNLICLVLYLLFGINHTESMGLSNALVIPVNAMMANIIGRKGKGNVLLIVFVLIDILTVVLYGSRGAILSIVVFIVLFYLGFNRDNLAKRMKLYFLFAFILIFVLLLRDPIIDIFTNLLGIRGLSSRTLDMLKNGTFLNENGRYMIWKQIMGYIRSNPFAIRGINADMLPRTGFYSSSNYSHNIVLELMYSFGVFFGLLLCIFFARKIIKTCSKVITAGDIIKLIFLCGFFPLCLFSGSLWESASWWIWLAFCNRHLDIHERVPMRYSGSVAMSSSKTMTAGFDKV